MPLEKLNNKSEAKRRADNKWQQRNLRVLSCKVRKEHAEAFKQYAEDRQTSVHALLKAYVLDCIDNDEETGK